MILRSIALKKIKWLDVKKKDRNRTPPPPRPQETPTRNLTFPLGSRLVPFRNEKILYNSGFSR